MTREESLFFAIAFGFESAVDPFISVEELFFALYSTFSSWAKRY